MTPDTGMKSDRGLDIDKEVVAKALAATIDEVYKRTGKNLYLLAILKEVLQVVYHLFIQKI